MKELTPLQQRVLAQVKSGQSIQAIAKKEGRAEAQIRNAIEKIKAAGHKMPRRRQRSLKGLEF